ncbi:MAG: hypothetical protein U9R02_03635 [Thermodesulfobacteriota bacterium]|nr:hypothetical protein [Thermodesulfobacteriota bacterium]
MLTDFCEDIREASVARHLNKSQTSALAKLKDASEEEFQKIVTPCRAEHSTGRQEQISSGSEPEMINHHSHKLDLRDLSAREVEEVARKAANKEIAHERNRLRISPSLNLNVKILLMSRLGIPADRIAARLKVSRLTVMKYSNDPQLVPSIRYFLAQGLSIPEIAEEQGCPEPLVWSIAFEGKSDQERFKSLNWGLRTWDYWYWNDVDHRRQGRRSG